MHKRKTRKRRGRGILDFLTRKRKINLVNIDYGNSVRQFKVSPKTEKKLKKEAKKHRKYLVNQKKRNINSIKEKRKSNSNSGSFPRVTKLYKTTSPLSPMQLRIQEYAKMYNKL